MLLPIYSMVKAISGDLNDAHGFSLAAVFLVDFEPSIMTWQPSMMQMSLSITTDFQGVSLIPVSRILRFKSRGFSGHGAGRVAGLEDVQAGEGVDVRRRSMTPIHGWILEGCGGSSDYR